MRVKSNVKAGQINLNHNQTVKGLRVKSSVKAGYEPPPPGPYNPFRDIPNHNQTVRGMRVRSKVKAGIDISDCGPWHPGS